MCLARFHPRFGCVALNGIAAQAGVQSEVVRGVDVREIEVERVPLGGTHARISAGDGRGLISPGFERRARPMPPPILARLGVLRYRLLSLRCRRGVQQFPIAAYAPTLLLKEERHPPAGNTHELPVSCRVVDDDPHPILRQRR